MEEELRCHERSAHAQHSTCSMIAFSLERAGKSLGVEEGDDKDQEETGWVGKLGGEGKHTPALDNCTQQSF